MFQISGLKISIETNLHIAYFLGVTSNLRNGKYYPFRRPNNVPLCISALSNHSKNIKKSPNMIGKRISEISLDEHEFEKAKGDYNKALDKSRFSGKFSAIN